MDTAQEVDPALTFTSDFYQVPVAGGVPIKLTIDNTRRPFTPPFVQLTRKGDKTQKESHLQAQQYINSQNVSRSNMIAGARYIENEEE